MTESDRAALANPTLGSPDPLRASLSDADDRLLVNRWMAPPTRHCAAHSDWPALDQHLVGLSNRRCGAALPDRHRAKPARASERDGFHPAPSRHCAVRTVGRLRASPGG